MRGNHRIWGRQDYIEPEPLSSEALAQIAACVVTPRRPDRTEKFNWHEVRIDGVLIGFVKTGICGQSYRTPSMDFWLEAASGNHRDPPHSQAILRLLEVMKMEAENELPA